MNIAFFHYPLKKDFDYDRLSKNLVSNILTFGYEPYHLTLKGGPDYQVPRMEMDLPVSDLMHSRMVMYERFVREVGPAWFIDTDAVINKPLEEPKEDVLLTWREMDDCYNGGVMFVRDPEFLKLCLELYPEDKKAWWGDQIALKRAMGGDKPPGKYRVLNMIVRVEPCSTWNYTPEEGDTPEDVKDKYIVHFKGSRKRWLL